MFDRYKKLDPLLRKAIREQGALLLGTGDADATSVAVDQTLLPAKGPPQARNKERRPGADPDAGWGYSEHHKWIYGYSLEVIVTATEGSIPVPLSASVAPANTNGARCFLQQIEHLPDQTRYVLGDRAYDTNACGEGVEYGDDDRPNGRHMVCPLMGRAGKPKVGRVPHRGRRERSRRRRADRLAFFESDLGKRLYARRNQTVEPFNEWLKQKFSLHDRVWHRGRPNNETQLLTAVFAYQLLVRYNLAQGNPNARTQWILDAL